MKKLTTILLTSITLLSALEKPTPLVLEVVKKRDVLQENRVLLTAKVKDSNSSYGYLWKEGDKVLGNSNLLKTRFSNGEHNVTVEVSSKNGEKSKAMVTVKAWRYKTVTTKLIPWDDSVHLSNQQTTKIIDYRDELKEDNKFVTKKYDKEGNLVMKIVEKPIENQKDKFNQTLYIYHNDKSGNCIKEDSFEYLLSYSVTLDSNNKIIERDKPKDFNQSKRSHLVTHYKYDEQDNKIWQKVEAIREGKNIIHTVIHGAMEVDYVYNSNRDIVKEMALNQCSATRGRTFSYFYHDDSYQTN
jgi:hypothetical protein